jgi:glycosyltransferase involved in cell wall biosynthesis
MWLSISVSRCRDSAEGDLTVDLTRITGNGGRPLRIAVIAPPWLAVPPTGYGGTETVLDTLCRSLRAAGHDVLLYATGDSTCPVERAWTYPRAVGTENIDPVTELCHVLDAYGAAREWGAEVIHDHTLAGPCHARHLPGLSVVTTNHGPFDEILAPLYRSITPRVPVIAISHHQARGAGGIPIAAVIHHGIDHRAIPVGSGSGGYAVCLGRMNPTKGIHAAVEVARAAGIPLRIAAKMREPAERDYYRSRVEPLLGGDIEYIGEVGGDDKFRLLADARCLLNPIAWPEPFGMVMLEALACGTPVVTTPCGAAPELVDEGVTGFIRAGTVALAAAVGRVDELDRAACRAGVEARFSMERLAADHTRTYRRTRHEQLSRTWTTARHTPTRPRTAGRRSNGTGGRSVDRAS